MLAVDVGLRGMLFVTAMSVLMSPDSPSLCVHRDVHLRSSNGASGGLLRLEERHAHPGCRAV